MTIHYVSGDATQPCRTPALIMHICNDAGKWGAGFVVPLGRRYPAAMKEYKDAGFWPLSSVQFVPVSQEPIIAVANMIAQAGVRRSADGSPPIRYNALDACLSTVRNWLIGYRDISGVHFSVHAPRIGCGLAGGTWNKVGPMIEHHLGDFDVFIYDLVL